MRASGLPHPQMANRTWFSQGIQELAQDQKASGKSPMQQPTKKAPIHPPLPGLSEAGKAAQDGRPSSHASSDGVSKAPASL